MRIIDFGHEFHITWEWDHWHKRNLEAVKAIGTSFVDPFGQKVFVQGSKYMVTKDRKYWSVSAQFEEQVLQLQFTHRATIIIASQVEPEKIGELPPMAELTIDLPLKEGTILRPYQKQGIAQAIKMQRCLIGDEPGLGKTIQSIATMLGNDAFPCLVVCPSSLKQNWKREWEKFSHKRAMVLDAGMSAKLKKNWFSYLNHGMVDVVIVNYESLATFCVEYFPQVKTATGKRKPWKALDVVLKPCMSMFKGGIVDESHRLKDPSTRQSKFVLRIFNGLTYRLLLSGTPIVNKPVDLFPQLAILGKLAAFGGKDKFMDRYCEGGSGANNLRELNYKLNLECFFRREKKDVAKDLPPKMRQTILCEITNRDEYRRCEADLETFLISKGLTNEQVMQSMGGEAIVQMMKLKQIAARGKMNEVTEFVNEILEAGEKLILFCDLHEIVDACKAIWPDAVTITGRDNMTQRQRHIDAFQNDPACQLIVCNHKAAGVGLTLTASSRVGFIEYPWTYADCAQCEDRAHRIGQVNSVQCTYFLGQDTIDERMWEIISTKMTIGNTITGATDTMDEMETIDKTLTLFKN